MLVEMGFDAGHRRSFCGIIKEAFDNQNLEILHQHTLVVVAIE